MIRAIDLGGADGLAVIGLQREAYAVEAAVIGFAELPPLEESLEELRGSGETFYGYVLGGAIVGAISYRREGGTVDIYRMMVHPRRFRQGIATALLDFLERIESDGDRIIVSTGRDNAPAHELYRGHGFRPVRDEEIVPGLWLTHFAKELRC